LASGKVGIGTLHAAIRTKVGGINIGNPGAEIEIFRINLHFCVSDFKYVHEKTF
jgi:hypothetical protein